MTVEIDVFGEVRSIISSPAPPYKLSLDESDELESKVSLPPLPFRVSAPPLPLRTLSLLSPFRVSALDPPVRFSKLVALAVVKVSVVFVAGVLSSKDKVSVPAPPLITSANEPDLDLILKAVSYTHLTLPTNRIV